MKTAKQYLSNPVTIEAIQYELGEIASVLTWMQENGGQDAFRVSSLNNDAPEFTILTLEGEMQCPVGWWIIKGTKGEFYPCRDDVFREKYSELSSGQIIDVLGEEE